VPRDVRSPARLAVQSDCVSVSNDLLYGERLGARLDAMNARVDQLLDEVLALPVDERSAVAVALLDSLEEADADTVSSAWREEVRRRRDELRAGKVLPIPWVEVKQRFRTP
jgi:putative addiction module component (TIGR02574 family)